MRTRKTIRTFMQLVPAVLLAAGSAWADGFDPCPRSALLDPGPTNGPYFATVTPNESFTSRRAHTFPFTCNVAELAGRRGRAPLSVRSGDDFPIPYNIVTRERDELFILYGTGSTEECTEEGAAANSCTFGAMVARVDSRTLEPVWRTLLYDTQAEGEWDYPGAMAVHGNGFLYVVGSYRVTKLDPDTGMILAQNELPNLGEKPGRIKGDTTYNGFVVLSDGNLVMKSMQRTRDCTRDSVLALFTCFDFAPSMVSVVDPDTLEILDTVDLPQAAKGRITSGIFGDAEYVYLPGADESNTSGSVWRFVYEPLWEELRLDPGWGPVSYVSPGQAPGTAVGLMGDFAVVQTNFGPALTPLSVTVISQADDQQQTSIQPFKDIPVEGPFVSNQFSLPTIDPDNLRIFSYDAPPGAMAGLQFDPSDFSLSVLWQKDQRTNTFGALVGPVDDRDFAITSQVRNGSGFLEQLVFRDADTGRVRARGPFRDAGVGNPLAPAFQGKFFTAGSSTGELFEWTVHPGEGTVCHKGKQTLSIGAEAVAAHLNHGDTLGPCE